MRIAGWIVATASAFALLQAVAAAAASPSERPREAAVDIYVEELPTATGAVPVDPKAIASGAGARTVGATRTAGTGSSLIWFGLVVAGVTGVTVLIRVGSRDNRHGGA